MDPRTKYRAQEILHASRRAWSDDSLLENCMGSVAVRMFSLCSITWINAWVALSMLTATQPDKDQSATNVTSGYRNFTLSTSQCGPS